MYSQSPGSTGGALLTEHVTLVALLLLANSTSSVCPYTLGESFSRVKGLNSSEGKDIIVSTGVNISIQWYDTNLQKWLCLIPVCKLLLEYSVSFCSPVWASTFMGTFHMYSYVLKSLQRVTWRLTVIIHDRDNEYPRANSHHRITWLNGHWEIFIAFRSVILFQGYPNVVNS